jgi:hypothetical protein
LKETRFNISARQLRVQINTFSFLDISKNELDGEFTEDLIISMIIWCQMLLDWTLDTVPIFCNTIGCREDRLLSFIFCIACRVIEVRWF